MGYERKAKGLIRVIAKVHNSFRFVNCYGCVFNFRDPKLVFYVLLKYSLRM